jgi:hypothetical protein
MKNRRNRRTTLVKASKIYSPCLRKAGKTQPIPQIREM